MSINKLLDQMRTGGRMRKQFELVSKLASKVHIVPSGMDVALCGCENPKLETSLGCACTCNDCYKIAQELTNKNQEEIK
jgi:hypothetical protein